MLVFDKLLILLKRILIIFTVVVFTSVIYIKFFMYNISNEIVAIERKIEELSEVKHTLNVELTYLASTERLLNLIDKNPNILSGKNIAKPNQLKSKEEFKKSSFAKAKNNPLGLNDYAINNNNRIN